MLQGALTCRGPCQSHCRRSRPKGCRCDGSSPWFPKSMLPVITCSACTHSQGLQCQPHSHRVECVPCMHTICMTLRAIHWSGLHPALSKSMGFRKEQPQGTSLREVSASVASRPSNVHQVRRATILKPHSEFAQLTAHRAANVRAMVRNRVAGQAAPATVPGASLSTAPEQAALDVLAMCCCTRVLWPS